MQEYRARALMKKYREGTLSDQERALLESWYLELARTKDLAARKDEISAYLREADDLSPTIHMRQTNRFRPVVKWVAAAAAIATLLFSGNYWIHFATEKNETVGAVAGTDAMPGDNRALLTLANGQSISLDQARNGKLAQEGNMSITKTQEGEVVYSHDNSTENNNSLVAYNKIETPKAGQYRVTLPDGTQAWLNAASSIRFPTVFPEGEREVEISGEIYFEVARVIRNKKRVPFRVYSRNQAIEVLGTAFNVNSYPDEDAIRTTLVEGSIQVKVKNSPKELITLKPGQQSRLVSAPGNFTAGTSKIDVKEVDTETAVAWKKGYFTFDGIGLPELMRQFSRWYDVKVVYEGNVGDYEFVGQIARTTKLSKALQILEMGGVQFRIEDKTIIVTK